MKVEWPHKAAKAQSDRAILSQTVREGSLRVPLIKAALALGLSLPFSFLFAGQAQAATCTPQSGFTDCVQFNASGSTRQTLVVPAGVTTITVKVWGAGGGGTTAAYWPNYGGGGGGFTTATFAVVPGETLIITVGMGGQVNSIVSTYGGGGAGGRTNNTAFNGGSGGGGSGVWRGTEFVNNNQLAIAGGGGGSSPGQELTSWAGAGGGLVGHDGTTTSYSGSGGTATSGGAAASIVGECGTNNPTSGTQFYGGTGGGSASFGQGEGGGGGGGGWYGGGGGRCQTTGFLTQNGSGGGGSGYFTGTGSSIAGSDPSAGYTGGAAANTSDVHYVGGVGTGGGTGAGGNGLVIIQFNTVFGTPETFSGPVNLTGTPATAITNVRANDKIGAAVATSTNSTIAQSGVWPTGLSLSTTTGAITYTNAVAPGTYPVAYTLCDKSVPAKCVTVNDTVTLNSVIVATNDAVTGINGLSGQTNVLNVYTGDTVNGAPATTGNAVLSLPTGSIVPPGLVFDPASGVIDVNPHTMGGTYTFTYQICEKVAPANCKTATASVTVNPSADLVVAKTSDATAIFPGDTVNYTITVTNNGPDVVAGPVVKDTPGAGLNCPAGNAVTFTGSGAPSGSYTFGNLSGTGVTLGTIGNGQSVTITYACTLN